MEIEDPVLRAIYGAIDEINVQLSKERQLQKSIRQDLITPATKLDSVIVVMFIVALEQAIQEECGTSLNLIDETALGNGDSPFRDVTTLSTYIRSILKDKAGD